MTDNQTSATPPIRQVDYITPALRCQKGGLFYVRFSIVIFKVSRREFG